MAQSWKPQAVKPVKHFFASSASRPQCFRSAALVGGYSDVTLPSLAPYRKGVPGSSEQRVSLSLMGDLKASILFQMANYAFSGWALIRTYLRTFPAHGSRISGALCSDRIEDVPGGDCKNLYHQ
eukprot:1146483-Pelagomonas_calceolata.AAC.2